VENDEGLTIEEMMEWVKLREENEIRNEMKDHKEDVVKKERKQKK
jgi:hypothetical protein